MKRETIIDNAIATLWYYPEAKIVHHQFHKFAKGKDFREILMRGVQVVEEHKCQKWLSDDRDIGVLDPKDQVWADENWFPQMAKAGWKYWALIMPKTAVGQMSLRRVLDYFLKKGIEAEVFDSPKVALEWLASK